MRRIPLLSIILFVSALIALILTDFESVSAMSPAPTLPEAIFLQGTPAGAHTDVTHLLILQNMVMIEETGPEDGWYARSYRGGFQIRECLADDQGNVLPGEYRGEGRFLELRTREHPMRGTVRFEGEIVVDQGLPPFDLPGYQSAVQGQFAGIDPDGPPWNRLSCSARLLDGSLGTDLVSWSGVKRRFR